MFRRFLRHRQSVPGVHGDQAEHRHRPQGDRHARGARPERSGDPHLAESRPRLVGHVLVHESARGQDRLGKGPAVLRGLELCVHVEDHELGPQQAVQLHRLLRQQKHLVTRSAGNELYNYLYYNMLHTTIIIIYYIRIFAILI